MENNNINQNPQAPVQNTAPVLEQPKKKPSTALKVTVLVILVVLLIAGIILPIKIVPNALTSVKSFFATAFKSTEKVALSTNTDNIYSGQPVTLSWNGDHRSDGSYSLSYPCTAGVSFQTSMNQANEPITCNTPFYFATSTNSIIVTPSSTSSRFIDVPVTLSFMANNASTTEKIADLTITITNTGIADSQTSLPATATSTASTTVATASSTSTQASSTPVVTTETTSPATTTTTTTKTPSSTPTTTTKHVASNPNGTTDLAVRIVSTGYTSNGQFVPSSYVYNNVLSTVKFVIVNNGTKNTGAWSFTANLPSSTHPTYTALNQQNLGPGDSIEYTLSFTADSSVRDEIITITADPSNLIKEISKVNNTASIHMTNIGAPVGTVSSSTGTVSSVGASDLSVKILQTGIIDPTTNAFKAEAGIQSSDMAAVRFQVTNNGSQATGAWTFGASLPVNSSYQNYTSSQQPSLAPGQSVVLVMSFNFLHGSGANVFTITADPQHQLIDSNTANNSATGSIYEY